MKPRPTTEGAMAQSFANQVGNIGAIVTAHFGGRAVHGAARSPRVRCRSPVRERTNEIGALKAIGLWRHAGARAHSRWNRCALVAAGRRPWDSASRGCSALGGDPTGGFMPIWMLRPQDMALASALAALRGTDRGCSCPRSAPVDCRSAVSTEEGIAVSFFKQAFTVILLGLYTIPQRLSSVGVADRRHRGRRRRASVGVLSIAREDSRRRWSALSRPDRAIVMRQGADSEMSAASAARKWTSSSRPPASRRTAAVSARLRRNVRRRRRQSADDRTPGRMCRCSGVEQTRCSPFGLKSRSSQAGCSNFGTNEIVVGRAASEQFSGLRGRRDVQVRPDAVAGVSACSTPTARRRETRDLVRRASRCRAHSGAATLSVRPREARVSRRRSTPFKDWLSSNPPGQRAIVAARVRLLPRSSRGR